MISQIAQPFLLGRALDASKDGNRDVFTTHVVVALVLAVLGTISAYIFEVIVMNSSQKAIKNARDDIYQKINIITVYIKRTKEKVTAQEMFTIYISYKETEFIR